MADGGGCTNCKSKGGCDSRKGGMFAAIDEALERLYPSRRWGERDEEAAFRGGVPRADAVRLAEDLAARLDTMALFRPGGADDPCDYVYVLCLGRSPSIVEIREGAAGEAGGKVEVEVEAEGERDGEGSALPSGVADEMVRGQAVDEVYLRVALSGLARFAAVQQVGMRMTRREDGDALVITETPRTGVFDPILLRRFQSLVAALAEHE